MKKQFILGLLMFLPVLFTSCAKYFAEEEEEADPKTMTTLRVTPRSGGEAQLEYPIKVYAFNSEGKCVGQQTIESSEGSPSISLALPKEDCRIVALSGITENEYDFPEQPSLTDVIRMKQGNKAKVPLMMGNATVNLGAKTTANASLTLNYVVAQLKIALSNIPSGASNVKVEITSSYSQLSFSGKYENGKNSVVAPCEQSSDGIWDTGTFYTFVGSETNTIFSIHMIPLNKEEETYGYTYNNNIQAGQPYILKGNYEKLIISEGNISFGGWKDPINVDFNFGKDSEESKPGNDDADNINSNDAFTDDKIPDVNSIWNGCLVVEVTPNSQGNEAEVMLMGIKNATNAKGKEKMLKVDADAAINKYSINGIYNWRIPTEEEVKLLKKKYNNNLSDINKTLSNAGGKGLGLDDIRYFCNDAIYTFNFKDGGIISRTGTGNYYLRPVKTIHITKK